MKNKKRTVSRFPFSYENEKRMKVLKIQRKNLLNMKMVVSYLNFVFFIEVKTKSRYRILNFVFQFTKNTKWHFGLSVNGSSDNGSSENKQNTYFFVVPEFQPWFHSDTFWSF